LPHGDAYTISFTCTDEHNRVIVKQSLQLVNIQQFSIEYNNNYNSKFI